MYARGHHVPRPRAERVKATPVIDRYEMVIQKQPAHV
jgi:hypothetical protein